MSRKRLCSWCFLNFPSLASKACRNHKTILITLPCTLARKEPPKPPPLKKKKKTWDFTAGFSSSAHEGTGHSMTPGLFSRWGSGLLMIDFSLLLFPTTLLTECLTEELNTYQRDTDVGCPRRPQALALMFDTLGFDH